MNATTNTDLHDFIRSKATARLFRDCPDADQPRDAEITWEGEDRGVVTLTNVNGPIASYEFRAWGDGLRFTPCS